MIDPNPDGLDPVEREILARRTTTLARADREIVEAKGIDVLVVRSGGRAVGIPLDHVIVAIALRRLTLVPFAPPELAGISLLDGLVTPVFHLHVLLGLSSISLPEHARVVLVGDRAAPLALVVEVAESIVRIDPATLLPLPETAGRVATRTRGITRDGTLLLDVSALLADPAVTLDIASRDQDTTS
jgi:purine-binding chemotaxis protein CheW